MSSLPTALTALAVLLTLSVGVGIAWLGVDQGVQVGSVAGIFAWGALLLSAERREEEQDKRRRVDALIRQP